MQYSPAQAVTVMPDELFILAGIMPVRGTHHQIDGRRANIDKWAYRERDVLHRY